ncbi:MAG TPA: pseudouridine synthase [Desulfuromonadales bacterium]|nr:pseudouridine synthase [Desulfuromonadales bacterium]
MGISLHPSTVTMPPMASPFPSIIDFLCNRFPLVAREIWQQRIVDGKVCGEDGNPITVQSAYLPQGRLFYFREVATEPLIPFAESILFQDDHLLVACKPHFLPVTPGGRYVQECLLNRLRRSTGIETLAPLHRIDRETAGIVLFSVNPGTRSRYAELFLKGNIKKNYRAISAALPPPGEREWQVENRIARGEPWFRMAVVPGRVNARSMISLLEMQHNRALFHLQPHTGKTHQLRIHLSGLGYGIEHDRYYPQLQPERADNFLTPLQLLAKSVHFRDPLSGVEREFCSERELMW